MVAPIIIAAAITAASILAPYIGRAVAGATQPAEVQKELAKPQVQQSISQAQQQVSESTPGFPNTGFNVYNWVPGAEAYYAGAVQNITEQKLKAQGYSSKEAKKIAAGAGAVQTGGGIGDIAGTLGVSALSARMATKAATKGITKAATKGAVTGELFSSISPTAGIGYAVSKKVITRQTVKASAIAGAYEGATSTVIQTGGKEGRVPTATELLLGTVAGAATASAGGYLLLKAYQKGAKTGKLADWIGSSLIDPYEKPGDIIGGMKLKGVTVVKNRFGIYTVVPSPAPTPSTTPTTTQVPTQSISPTPTPTPTPVPTPDIVVSPTWMPTPTPTPVPTPEPTETPVPVVTPTTTATPVTVPSSTIQPRNIPAVPLIGRPPGADFKGIKAGALTYYNEWAQARGLSRRLIGV